METLLREVRLATRSLIRAPGFTVAAVLTLALGIGANTAMFSAVHAVLLSPLPFPDEDRLTVLWLDNKQEGIRRDVTSYPNFQDWSEAESYAAVAAHSSRTGTLTGEGDAVRLAGSAVTGRFFDVLGVRPALGRAIGEGDTSFGAAPVVVLSHGTWVRHFGSDPAVIGRTIRLSGSREVVGVMPPGLTWPDGAEFWTGLAPDEESAGLFESRNALWLGVVGRLAPGVSVDAASSEMATIMDGMREEYPNLGESGVFVEPLRDTIVGDVRPALLLLLGAVGFVLLIACANVANLLLARGAGRQRERAVRGALGATAGRLAREALIESLVLAGTGGAIGVLFALWGTSALVVASPAELPRVDAIGINAPVIAFTAALSLATGLLFGIVPALQARTAAIGATLREGGRGSAAGRGGMRPVLVAAEVALSLILLVGAGLLLRSFATLQSVDPGFATEDVLNFRVVLGTERYTGAAEIRTFQDQLMESVEALPGVTGATAINTLFLARLPNMSSVVMEGAAPPQPGETITSVTTDFVEPGFFETMDVAIVRGRPLEPTDVRDGLPVAVVNEAFVRHFSPDADPVGRRFTWGDPQDTAAVWHTIVGVAADTRRSGLTADVRPEAYRSMVQYGIRGMDVLVRTSREPLALVPEIRSLVRRLDPDLPLASVRTVEQGMAEAVATRRFIMLLLAGFAAVAVVLTAVGIYSVLAYLVTRRTREIGVRIALGAARADVLGLIVRDGLRSIVPGIVVGIAGALLLTRVLASQLFGVSPTDPLTFAGVTALLMGVALAATWAPARRAARLEPMETLREE